MTVKASLLVALELLCVLSCCWAAAGAEAPSASNTGNGTAPLTAPLAPPDTLAGRTNQVKVLHPEARIFLYEDFLSADECDKFIELATPRLKDAAHGPDRAVFKRGEVPIIRDIEQRISDLTLMPVHHGDGLALKRYYPKKRLSLHWDYFHQGNRNGGQNYCTVLMYLSDVEEGGETIFPYIPAPGGGGDLSYSECARDYLAIKPKKGRAVVFHGTRPNGAFEPRTLHDACPVIKGTKFSMQKFVHIGTFAEKGSGVKAQDIHPTINPAPVEPAADCPDMDSECGIKAMKKECHTDRGWMVGDAARPGHCLSTCLRCDIWRQHLRLVQQQQEQEDAERHWQWQQRRQPGLQFE